MARKLLCHPDVKKVSTFSIWEIFGFGIGLLVFLVGLTLLTQSF